jgi:hypothetical protein
MKRYAIVVLVFLVAMAILVVAAERRQKQKEPIVPRQKIVLWNGRDFSGWKLFVEDAEHDVIKTWSVRGGVIWCEGQPAGYMRTEGDYANYSLHVEWRWPEGGGNSGVLFHMSIPDKIWPKSVECQLMSGNAGDFWLIGGVETKEHAEKVKRVGGRRVRKLKESSEKPLGEWNVYEIISKDDWIVVFVNGVLQNVATKASVTSGKICLQSEGRAIEFRNIYIEPVE